MASAFSTDFKELVRSRTDIVELVSETVTLEPKRGGREYLGLCPFHDDHNPSLTVSPERQFYKCWSCGAGGDCFSFVMGTQNVDFRAALEMLAERANLEVPKTAGPGGAASRDRKKRIYEALAWADNEFHNYLVRARDAEPARRYLAERGFSSETIARFGLGYHPPDWEWLLGRARDRFRPEELAAARLVRERRDGNGYRDDFVDRVLFPIRDVRGRTVAFGGRILPGTSLKDAPKYLNSSDSPVFAKNSLLYGFDVAREPIRRSGTAVVVEGYTDCITLHQHGLETAVGILGTALTDAHVSLLKRFARTVVLVYDGDEAGQRAAERALRQFLARRLDLRVMTLPPGVDPADFIETRGSGALTEGIRNAPEAWAYKLQQSIERNGTSSIDGCDRIVEEMLELLAEVPGLSGSAREDALLFELSRKSTVGQDKVRRRLAQLRDRKSTRSRQRPAAAQQGAVSPQSKAEHLECELLEIIFSAPRLVAFVRREVDPSEFTHDDLRSLLQTCYRLADADAEPSVERVTLELEDPELKRRVLFIDEQARKKDIPTKLRADEAARPEDGCPRFLELAIHGLKWREQEQSHQRSKGEMAAMTQGGEALDDNARDLLRRRTEYNQQRATRKALH